MIITKEVFEDYLECPRKAYLKNSASLYEPTKLGMWKNDHQNKQRQAGLDFLQKQTQGKRKIIPMPTESVMDGSVLHVNCSIRTEEVMSVIDAVEKTYSRGRLLQLVPYRCQLQETVIQHDKMLLAYDGLCLQNVSRVPITVGKLVNGAKKQVRRVYLQGLFIAVHAHLRQLTYLTRKEKEPQPIINKHCVECEFREPCRSKAIEVDDLSLLKNMSIKERTQLRTKGIFTINQLSYTFRPRRRSKNPHSKSDRFSCPLKALAIRENKIHVAGEPRFTVEDNDGFLDIEGIPDRAVYFLAGLRIHLQGQTIQYSFWANDYSDEKTLWKSLLKALQKHQVSRIVHFGSYDRDFLESMNRRYSDSKGDMEYVETLIRQSVNLLSVIYSRIYFPTYSNSLKDIGQYLGHQWPDEIRTGYEALLARRNWEASPDDGIKNSLIEYNASDCEALALVAQRVSQLCSHLSAPKPNENSNFVDTNKLRGWGPFKFGSVNFVTPDFEYINRASYWDYQRERIVLRSHRLSKRINIGRLKRRNKYRINKVIDCRQAVTCLYCKSRNVHKWGPMSKIVFDLKFSPMGVKRWVVKYRFNRQICWTCNKTFVSRNRPWGRSKFGAGLIRYFAFLTIDIQISRGAARKLLTQFFGLELPRESIGRLNRTAAKFYEATYKKILRSIITGNLIHADETKVILNGRFAYVWVLANQENVVYFFSDTREGAKVQEILKNFRGVLVSDFYSVYDSFECLQQKCLIHLIRDLNDDLLRQPFNEELKSLGGGFSSLVKPIVETIDRHGLKARYLRKYKRSVAQFFRWLAKANFQTEVTICYMKRFAKNREKLFTFLDYDDVPWNNNAAEHAIKAFATLRRVLGGQSSEMGIQDCLILLSLCETCRYRGINFWDFLCSGSNNIDAYIKGHQPRVGVPFADGT